MQRVLNYIESQPLVQAEIMYFLYDYFSGFPTIECKYKFRVPFYYQKTWVCYTSPKKTGAVELVFVRGRELLDSPHLHANGRKMAKGIMYQSVDEISLDILEPIVYEALELDRTTPYTFQKHKSKS